jgi:hypothetical protein
MTREVIDWGARTFDSRSADLTGIIETERTMTDVNTIAHRYIELWNERTPSRRREMLATNWTSDARYIDPLMSGDGHDGVDALIAGVQQRFPDFRFQLIGQPNGYGDHVRFSWGLGPEGADSPIKGTDFAVVKDGRIRSITGFLDQVPQGA